MPMMFAANPGVPLPEKMDHCRRNETGQRAWLTQAPIRNDLHVGEPLSSVDGSIDQQEAAHRPLARVMQMAKPAMLNLPVMASIPKKPTPTTPTSASTRPSIQRLDEVMPPGMIFAAAAARSRAWS